MRRLISALILTCASAVALALGTTSAPSDPLAIDKEAERWVKATLQKMTLDEKIGQMIVTSAESGFLPTDSAEYDRLSKLVSQYRIGGVHVFGASEPVPNVLLNPSYGAVLLGEPLEAASLLNRLQAISTVPLLNTADFEAGVGFRLAGGTTFPRAMAFGAAGDEKLAYQAGRITGVESKAVGILMNFAPVVDVNNNARNPVINTRSFGEDPARVGALASAYVRGIQDAGVGATLKHFPGHGDTAVDSHLGLPVIQQPRERLQQVEWPSFKAGIASGAEAVMTGHIEMPMLDPTPGTPTTLSRPIVTGILRDQFGFEGLIYTDSMQMAGVTKLYTAADAAVRAVKAGNDIILHSPDDVAAIEGIKAAVEKGDIAGAQIDASVTRILRAKARAGLNKNKLVSLESIPSTLGSRANQATADEVSRRSMTLIKDERNQVPMKLPKDAAILYLSVLDYPIGWRIAAPSRTFIPELKGHWPNVTAIELSDRTTANELELVRAMVPRFDAIVVSTFVRAASASGRMDLAEPLVRLLQDVARVTAPTKQPFVTVMFGNPYTATFVPELPAVLLTYDFYDRAEASAVRAIAGDASITGKLPIALPNMYPVGHGITR